MGWATFSQTHLVTLVPEQQSNNVMKVFRLLQKQVNLHVCKSK
jgi:hypothetical protein